MKNKETYAKAKTILEKYGETIAPDVRPTSAVSDNANKGMSQVKVPNRFHYFVDPRQRAPDKTASPAPNRPPVSGKKHSA